MKRIALVLAMLAGSVFIAASPASAHTQNMDVSAVCQADGTYDVTYTLNYANGDAPGKAFKRTGSTSFSHGWSPSTWNDWQAAGTLNSGSGSLSWHRTLPGTTTVAPWEYTYIKWDDDFVTKGDTRPEGLKGNCLPPDDTDHKINICHLPPGNPANGQVIEVDYDSIINGTGHGNDGLDIIPPFNYTKQGVPGSFPGQNWNAEGQAQYNNGCDEDKPDQPSPKVEEKNETGQPNCVEKTVTTTFYTRSTPYVFDENSWTWVLGTTGAWVIDHTTTRAATSQECPTTVTPVAPTVAEITECGTDGLVTLPTTEGVTYEFDPAGPSPSQGPWKVVATPKSGFVFADGATTTWSGNLGVHTECPVVVTPVAPSVTDIAKCGEFGNVVLPTTEGVTYAFDPAGPSPTEGPWKVTATANEGFVFADGASTSWNGNLGVHTTCVTPVAPSVTDIAKCGEFGNVILPTTEGVTYAFDPAGPSPTEGPWKVTATANEGFVIADGASTSWNGDLGTHTTCATPVAPSVLDISKCGEFGDVELPETEGVTYAFDPDGDSPTEGPWKVTATANEGFSFPADTQTTWSGDLGEHIECVVPVPPVVADLCGEDGTVSLPVTEGVTYAFTVGDGLTGEWTVTATAQEGFGFADDTVAEWSGTVTLPEECAGGLQFVIAEVVVDEICPGSELPTPTEVDGVVYAYTVGDGVEGPWEITATAEEGYELVGQSVFTGDAGEGECVEGESLEDDDDALLPDTGGVPLGLLLIGSLLTVAGVAVIGRQRFVE